MINIHSLKTILARNALVALLQGSHPPLLPSGGQWCPPTWALADWPSCRDSQGPPPHHSGHSVHISNSSGLILYYLGGNRAATADPAMTLGDLVSRGTSTGAREVESLNRQATTSLKPGGGATPDQPQGNPMRMSSQTPPLQPSCALQPADAGPSFLLNSGYSNTTSICPELEGSTQLESPAVWDVLLPSSWVSCYLEPSSHLPLHRGVSSSSASSHMVAIKTASSPIGSSTVAVKRPVHQ